MGIWSLVKEAYKGTKYVVSELNQGLETVNKNLEAFNAEQELKQPLRTLLHDIKMSRLSLRSLEHAVPSQCNQSPLLLENTSKLFDWLEKLIVYGIEDQKGCREFVLTLAESFGSNDYIKKCLTDVFLEEYPLNILEDNGYQQKKLDIYSEGYEKILQIKFAYSYDAVNIERNAKALNDEFNKTTLIQVNMITEKLNEIFGLNLNYLK